MLRAASGQSSGTQWAAGAPTGTVCVFYQSAAPTGWTITDNTYDDRAIRINNTSGGGTAGGSTAFQTVFTTRTIAAANLPNMTLSVTDAGHTHDVKYTLAQYAFSSQNAVQSISSGGSSTGSAAAIAATTGISVAINDTSRGSAQTTMDFAVKYLIMIAASAQ